MTLTDNTRTVAFDGDLDAGTFEEFRDRGREHGLAVDIETTGLDPNQASIQVISAALPEQAVVLTLNGAQPARMLRLLEDPDIPVIFHHALFDLRFLHSTYGVTVPNPLCTKVAARIASVGRNPHLSDLVSELAGVEIDKSLQTSDWSQRPLTADQLRYAANDVIYLHKVFRELVRRLSDYGRTQVFARSMRFLPTRVELEELGLGDVFAYRLD